MVKIWAVLWGGFGSQTFTLITFYDHYNMHRRNVFSYLYKTQFQLGIYHLIVGKIIDSFLFWPISKSSFQAWKIKFDKRGKSRKLPGAYSSSSGIDWSPSSAFIDGTARLVDTNGQILGIYSNTYLMFAAYYYIRNWYILLGASRDRSMTFHDCGRAGPGLCQFFEYHLFWRIPKQTNLF